MTLFKKGIKYFLSRLIIVVSFVILSSCGTSAENICNKLIDEIPNSIESNAKINIPFTYQDYDVSWSVNKPEYFDSSGNIIKTAHYDQEITLTIEVKKGRTFDSKSKVIILRREMMGYFETIENYLRSGFRPRTNKTLKLRYDYYEEEDVSISYQSSKPDIIGHDGIYYPHEYDEEVILTCQVNVRGQKHFFDIMILAIGIPDDDKAQKIKEWLDEYLLTTPLVDNMELPTTHPNYGGEIKWIANDPFVVINNKDFYLPKTSGEYLLMAEITYPSSQIVFKKRLFLKASPVSDLDYAIRFVKTAIPKDFKQFLVLYDGKGPNINKNLIGTDAKNFTFYPAKRTPSQAFLDLEFYEGYQLPNDINTIWIVVHETGNRNPGKNAKVHSDLQYKRAYLDEEPDAYTSWHYSVDDSFIYQSFDDSFQCWNAGDGDEYSIGIEMCINGDGFYEASLRNNAKLIASLLLKYNLNLENLRQHHDFASKMCPETILRDRRWFEFLDLIAKEYISLSLLSTLNINYVVKSNNLIEWNLPKVYLFNGQVSEMINISVKIEGHTFDVLTKATA